MTEENLTNQNYDIKLMQKQSKPADKKAGVIKEISKVLSEIEELKKTKKVTYFSNLHRKKVFDSTGTKVGVLKDLGITGGERFPEVSHLVLSQANDSNIISWSNVASLNDIIKLNKPFKDVERRRIVEDDVFLGEHILDKQVVDVRGLKVIRVNDIALTYVKNKLAVINIDIGTKSIFRRLGFEWLVDIIPINISDHPVPWDSVEPLSKSEKIHLKVQCARVADLHPADVAELFEELSHQERGTILRSMKAETAAKVLLECEEDVQKTIIRSLKTKRASQILEKLDANDAANMLAKFDRPLIEPILKAMMKDKSEKIRHMLSLEKDAAARYMNEQFIEVYQELTVEEAIEHIRKQKIQPMRLYYVYAVDDNKGISGAVSLKRIILANAKTRISEIMITKLIAADVSDPIQYVGELVKKYDLMAIPVVDVYGKIRGVINIDDILEIVIEKVKADEPIELTDEEKEELLKEKKLKFPFHIIRDAGQFIKWMEQLRPRKKQP